MIAPTRSTTTSARLAFVALIAIVLTGLNLRLQAALESVVDVPLRADAGEYFMYAHNLRNHGTYSAQSIGLEESKPDLIPSALRSPGYPLFLTLFLDTPYDSLVFTDIAVAQALLR